MTTHKTLYRGVDGRLPIASQDATTFFAVDDDEGWELAWRYTYGADEGQVYRAELSASAVRGTHEDFDNPMACQEGGDWVAEILEEMGADYMMHEEAGVTTIGIRTDRLSSVLADVEWQDKSCDWDEWRTAS